jgi:hypothetical protein
MKLRPKYFASSSANPAATKIEERKTKRASSPCAPFSPPNYTVITTAAAKKSK